MIDAGHQGIQPARRLTLRWTAGVILSCTALIMEGWAWRGFVQSQNARAPHGYLAQTVPISTFDGQSGCEAARCWAGWLIAWPAVAILLAWPVKLAALYTLGVGIAIVVVWRNTPRLAAGQLLLGQDLGADRLHG